MKKDSVVLLYSGGTDSTAAATLLSEKYKTIYLLTCCRSGLFNIDRTKLNVSRLKQQLKQTNFIHEFVNVDKLFKKISYSRYFYYLKKYGLFVLTTCGACKLAMHFHAIEYAKSKKISVIADGANKNSIYCPFQIDVLIEETKNFYKRYGLEYITPVYNYDQPNDLDWQHKNNLVALGLDRKKNRKKTNTTTGSIIFDNKIFLSPNVKGTKEDRIMQFRCFQLILFNIFVHGYYLSGNGYLKYKQTCLAFYREKMYELFDRQRIDK